MSIDGNWEFEFEQKVVVGTAEGKIVGRAEFTSKDDEYHVRVIGDDGLPWSGWFTESEISHGTKH